MKDKQEEALKHLLDGKDVFAVLPTGFGKSLIYQSFVIAKEMAGSLVRVSYPASQHRGKAKTTTSLA